MRLNVTGCPNGCARPYTSEIGIVGRTKSTYDLYVGGAVGGQRLNRRIAIGAKLDEMPKLLAPLLERYRVEAADGEGFGDFCERAIPRRRAGLGGARPAGAERRCRRATTDAPAVQPRRRRPPVLVVGDDARAEHKAAVLRDAGADVTRRRRPPTAGVTRPATGW